MYVYFFFFFEGLPLPDSGQRRFLSQSNGSRPEALGRSRSCCYIEFASVVFAYTH